MYYKQTKNSFKFFFFFRIKNEILTYNRSKIGVDTSNIKHIHIKINIHHSQAKGISH